MKLVIIRHGRSQNNIGVTQDPDSNLTDWGVQQCRGTGKLLYEKILKDDFIGWSSQLENDPSPHKLDYEQWKFHTSPFLRCLQTAILVRNSILGEHSKNNFTMNPSIDWHVEPLLREYMNHDEPESIEIPKSRSDNSEFIWSNVKFPCVFHKEVNEVFLERMIAFYKKLGSGNHVVVTHGLPAFLLSKIATSYVHHVPIFDYSIGNGSITYIKDGRTIYHGRDAYYELEE